MEWRGRKQSDNIEDRRRSGGAVRAGGIGGVGLLVVLAIGLFTGVDVTPLLNGGGVGSDQGRSQSQSQDTPLTPQEQAAGEFVSVVLGYTEVIWADVFRKQLRQEYQPVTLVLFRGATPSPCGDASGATGPFYCPSDRKVYLDTAFFATMERELGARGDFAMAYVVAHEVAHYVQDELGILGQANDLRGRVSQVESNEISVRIELQADCFSGIWSRLASNQLGKRAISKRR
jgi:predicted metalloprotease